MHDIQVVANGKDFIQSPSIIAEFITAYTEWQVCINNKYLTRIIILVFPSTCVKYNIKLKLWILSLQNLTSNVYTSYIHVHRGVY